MLQDKVIVLCMLCMLWDKLCMHFMLSNTMYMLCMRIQGAEPVEHPRDWLHSTVLWHTACLPKMHNQHGVVCNVNFQALLQEKDEACNVFASHIYRLMVVCKLTSCPNCGARRAGETNKVLQHLILDNCCMKTWLLVSHLLVTITSNMVM